MTRVELLAALKSAKGPDRDLDEQIHILTFDHKKQLAYFGLDETQLFRCGAKPTGRGGIERWTGSVHYTDESPKFTASLDAALSLVERVRPGCAWSVEHNMPKSDAKIWPVEGGCIQSTGAATPALALLIALLESMDADQSGYAKEAK